MATCASCGCDLPGTETLCRDCYEKQYAALSAPEKNIWKRLEPWMPPLLMLSIFASMFLTPDWFFTVGRALEPLGRALRRLEMALFVAWLGIQWVLMTGAVALGIWQSLQARSGKMVFLWLMYVPLVAGFFFWKVTHSGVWLAVTIGGGLLVEVQKYNARRRGLI